MRLGLRRAVSPPPPGMAGSIPASPTPEGEPRVVVDSVANRRGLHRTGVRLPRLPLFLVLPRYANWQSDHTKESRGGSYYTSGADLLRPAPRRELEVSGYACALGEALDSHLLPAVQQLFLRASQECDVCGFDSRPGYSLVLGQYANWHSGRLQMAVICGFDSHLAHCCLADVGQSVELPASKPGVWRFDSSRPHLDVRCVGNAPQISCFLGGGRPPRRASKCAPPRHHRCAMLPPSTPVGRPG